MTHAGELIQIPDVVLTKRLFERAHQEGITGITPDLSAIQAIGELTGVGAEFLPDITVLRQYDRSDVNFNQAPDDTRYWPATDLSVRERDTFYISKHNLSEHARIASKTILQLTVKDWDNLGQELADQIHIAQRAKQGYAAHASAGLGGFFGTMLGIKSLNTSKQKQERQARDYQPYTIHRAR